jgi:hypothetical protein
MRAVNDLRQRGGALVGLRAALRLLLLALTVMACLPVQAVAASPVITTEPSLRPGFSQAVGDYVVSCPDRSLTVAVRPALETRVVVDGRRTRERRTVPIEPGQTVPILVERRDRVTRHFVRCLPDDFPSWRFHRAGRGMPRRYLLTPGVHFEKPTKPFAAIFDRNGVPVWWYRASTGVFHDARLIGGHIAYAGAVSGLGFGTEDSAAYHLLRPDGSLVHSIQAVGSPTDFHDLQRLGRDYLVLTYRRREHVDLSAYGGPSDATVLDSEIQRINRRGRLIWSWSTRDHIDLAETGRWWPGVAKGTLTPDGSRVYDVTHINSVEPVGRGDLIISLRNTDAIYRIRMSDGRIRWKLGGTKTSRSLRVVGDRANYPLGGQHDARVWRGTVTAYDNGTELGRRPRVVRFEIDTKRRRAILREKLRDPRVSKSVCCGSARKLRNGNWFVGWGGPSGVSSLLSPRGRVISRLTFDDEYFSYRAVPARAHTLSAARLRAGMNALYAAGDAD